MTENKKSEYQNKTEKNSCSKTLILTLLSRFHSREDGSLSIVCCNILYNWQGDKAGRHFWLFYDRKHGLATGAKVGNAFISGLGYSDDNV